MTELKIGTIFKMPNIIVNRNVLGAGEGDRKDNALNSMKLEVFGFKKIKGKEYIIMDSPGYKGSMHHVVLKKDLSSIFNIKQTKMKKGDIIKIPSRKLHWNVVGSDNRDDFDTMLAGRKFQCYGVKGKYTLFDRPAYKGTCYYKILTTDLSSKTTNMTKTTAVTATKAKAFPRAELKTGMAFSCKQIPGPAIIVLEGNHTYICHNRASWEGGAPVNKQGFKYGWSLSGITKVDLTYGGQFKAIKLGAPVAKKAVKTPVKKAATTKEFVNTFGVVGSKTLLKAFAEEALAAGWKKEGTLTFVSYKDLYFKADAQFFREDGLGGSITTYKLPAQWDAALKAMKETKAVVKFPIYCTCTANCAGQYTKGRIYKITREDRGTYLTAFDDKGSTANGLGKSNFTLSTEKAFLAQAPLFVPIKTLGGWTVTVRTATVPGYESTRIPVICIGCTDSKQVYTKTSLESLLTALKTCGAATHPRGVKMDVKTVETLIEMLNKA